MYPTVNLQPGQSGPEVAQLQQFLKSQGLLSDADIATGPGIYGPRTTAAVQQWQQQNGVDNSSGPGYWGPRSIAVASGQGGGGGGETQESVDQQYREAAAKNPQISALMQGGSSIDEIFNSLQSGDLSGITDSQGMPFSPADQQKALAKAQADTKLYYDALKQKETADTEAALAKKQADFQDYLLRSGQQFEEDKMRADQSAADRGVLFSGSRVQREQKLQRAYEQDQATQLRNMQSAIGSTARDFQYQYGNEAAKGLSQYYNLGQNVYNPNVARGGVTSGGLSSVYNPSQYDFQGRRVAEQSAATQQRAAGLLWNQGNKLLATGYQNKY